MQGLAICDTFPNVQYSIDDYYFDTIDWSQGPSGHYFSNKAPGPAIVSSPLLCGLNLVAKMARGADLSKPSLQVLRQSYYLYEQILSIFFQIVPLIFLGFLFMKSRFASATLEHNRFGILALYFATTTSLFMNVWFGHAFAAILFTASLVSFFERKHVAFAFYLGMAILSDYGVIYALPAIVFLVLSAKRLEGSFWKACVKGLLLPVLLWCHYHYQSFGGILELPQKYLNPVFLEPASPRDLVWRVIEFFPRPEILWKLLVGPERGLLWTQPWIPFLGVSILYGILRTPGRFSKEFKICYGTCVLSLGGLLWMNASFGAWHAGGSSGPRYIASVLLVWALLVPTALDLFSGLPKKLLKFTLCYTLILNACIGASSILFPPASLWVMIWEWQSKHVGTFWGRLVLIAILVLWVRTPSASKALEKMARVFDKRKAERS